MEPGLSLLAWGLWYTLFLTVQAIFVSLLLLTCWVPLTTPQGGKTHIHSGYASLSFLAVILVNSLAWILFQFSSQSLTWEDKNGYILSLFVIIFLAELSYYGIRVLTIRLQQRPNRHPFDLGIVALLLVVGLSTSVYGLLTQDPKTAVVPWIGLIVGLLHLRYWLNPPSFEQQPLLEHIKAMYFCFLIAFTALSVWGIPYLADVQATVGVVLLWLWPFFILTPLFLYFIYQTRRALP